MNTKARTRRQRLVNQAPLASERPRSARIRAGIVWSVIGLAGGALCVVVFLHLDRHGWISNAIRASGAWGIVAAIFLMALFCVIPVPSEFLMIMNMKVFGVWWGILYTWVGAMLGALAVFFAARTVGRRLLATFISEDRLQQVNLWIQRKGALGLLLVRLLPLPFIVVNYAAGAFPSVRTRDYVWTTGVGLLPYDLGAALVFLGISKRLTMWLVGGSVIVLTIWIAGYLFHRRARKTEGWAH